MSGIATGNALLKHFVGSSEPGDQQKALDLFNQYVSRSIPLETCLSPPETFQKSCFIVSDSPVPNRVLDIGIKFKPQPEVQYKQAEIPETQSFDPMPKDGMTCTQLLECFPKISQHSTNFASPNFLGFPDAANSIPALGAVMLVPFINQNMCNQDIQAPAASIIEMEVVH